jgi:hypothetical protein
MSPENRREALQEARVSPKTKAEALRKLAEVVEALCDPHRHVERVPYWDASRNRKWREHATTQPGLLAQLAQLFPASSVQIETGSSAAKPAFASKPPGAFEALALHSEITIGVAKWAWTLGAAQRDTVESNLRALIGHVQLADLAEAVRLVDELEGWRRRAEVVTGWRSPPFFPRVACPVCDTYHAIAVNLARHQAWCSACSSSWDAETIGVLAEYVRQAGMDATTRRAAA